MLLLRFLKITKVEKKKSKGKKVEIGVKKKSSRQKPTQINLRE